MFSFSFSFVLFCLFFYFFFVSCKFIFQFIFCSLLPALCCLFCATASLKQLNMLLPLFFLKFNYWTVFLRYPFMRQTNDTTLCALANWNTLNCCTNKARIWKMLFLSGSISWRNEVWRIEACVLCVSGPMLPEHRHNVVRSSFPVLSSVVATHRIKYSLSCVLRNAKRRRKPGWNGIWRQIDTFF